MGKHGSKSVTRFCPAETVVVVCRGGDCGSKRKHKKTDHKTQLREFREGVDPKRATVAVSKCLDACDDSNVVVLVPGHDARKNGAGPVWLGRVLDEAGTDAILDWVNTGDLDVRPATLGPVKRIKPTKKNVRKLSTPGRVTGQRG